VNAHVVPVAVRVVDPHDSAAFGRDDPAPEAYAVNRAGPSRRTRVSTWALAAVPAPFTVARPPLSRRSGERVPAHRPEHRPNSTCEPVQ